MRKGEGRRGSKTDDDNSRIALHVSKPAYTPSPPPGTRLHDGRFMTTPIPNLLTNSPAIEIVRIFISSGHDYWTPEGEECLKHGIEELTEVECIAGRGLRGDRYSTGESNRMGQVTFISANAIQEIRDEFRLPQLADSIFRRNIVVRDMDLAQLLGTQFEIQRIQFEGAQECTPCQWMDRLISPGAQKFMQANFRGGLRAKILTNGILRTTTRELK